MNVSSLSLSFLLCFLSLKKKKKSPIFSQRKNLSLSPIVSQLFRFLLLREWCVCFDKKKTVGAINLLTNSLFFVRSYPKQNHRQRKHKRVCEHQTNWALTFTVGMKDFKIAEIGLEVARDNQNQTTQVTESCSSMPRPALSLSSLSPMFV